MLVKDIFDFLFSMQMDISIVTRALKTSELDWFFTNLKNIKNIDFEIIGVCSIEDSKIDNLGPSRIFIEKLNRFQARLFGIEKTSSENILLLDSDQTITQELLEEIINSKTQMVIVPEKSLRKDIVGRMLDDFRAKLEERGRKSPLPTLPVIPRFYRKTSLLRGCENLSSDVLEFGVSHEDSLLYYEVFKHTTSISFSKNYIFNNDPDLKTIIRKAFLYGKFGKDAFKSNKIPNEYLELIDVLNRNSFGLRQMGLSKGDTVQFSRALAYFLGYLMG